ncbi:MAG TPA: TlpA disulfide reductase family protein [Bryobacteraceae bacterium]|jgi:peroxiredoxin|nr:TlpA disulfide reductase family protein [Bryobacteraceae bacterium]
MVLQPGDSAPDINLPALDGSAWNLRAALKEGPVALAFFKISCPTCQLTFPFLQRMADSTTNGLRIVAVSQDDAPDTREFHQRFGVSMSTLTDAAPTYSASSAYKITSVPSIFVVETDGRIAWATEGFNKAALEDLGRRSGVAPFRENDHVPSLRPG